MDKEAKKKRVNYAYINKRLTIFGGLPFEIVIYLFIFIFFLFYGLLVIGTLFFVFFAVVSTKALKSGYSTFGYISAFVQSMITKNEHPVIIENPYRPPLNKELPEYGEKDPTASKKK